MENCSYQLMQAMFRLFYLFKPKSKESSLKPTSLMVIMSIIKLRDDNKGQLCTPSDICSQLGFSKSALTAILNDLEEQGLIIRTLSDKDRRNIYIDVTDKALEVKNSYHVNMENNLESLAEHLGKDDSAKLTELLNKSYNYLSSKKGSL